MPPTDVGVGISPRGLLSLGFGCHVQVFKDSYTFNTIYTFRTRQYYSRSIRTWRICPRRTWTSPPGACSRWASGPTSRYSLCDHNVNITKYHTIHTTFTVSTIRTVFAQGLRWLSAVSFAHFFVSRAQWLEFAATFENYHRNRNEPSDKDCRQILG